MKNFYLLFVFLSFTYTSFSQVIPFIKVNDRQLEMTSLSIEVQIVGNVATTTYDMLFYNPTHSVLEGEFNFPLGENQNVVRLALEINGRLREAVVVEKELGRTAFETVVRRGVDPVLLEKGTGNNYKARIYPIPANGYKRVVIAYDQLMRSKDQNLIYDLNLDFKKQLDRFKINIDVFGFQQIPQIIHNLKELEFVKSNTSYTTHIEKINYYCEGVFQILVPQPENETKLIYDSNYFYLYQPIKLDNVPREKPQTINLYWDQSSSMRNRDLKKELEVLDAYFNYVQNIEVHFITFSNIIMPTQIFKIENGEWEKLKKEIKKCVYDGGTDYKVLEEVIAKSSQISLIFTDGLRTLSHFQPQFTKEVFVINSLTVSDSEFFKQLMVENEGNYLNLNILNTDEALKLLINKKIKLLSVGTNNTESEIFPKNFDSVVNEIVVTGNHVKEGQTIFLNFGIGNQISKTISYKIEGDSMTLPKLGKLWAQQKLNYLQAQPLKNEKQIVELSKSFNIISDYTSLIVLEEVRDYVRYNITPPDDLKQAFDALVQNQVANTTNVNSKSDSNQSSVVEASQTNNADIFVAKGTLRDESGVLPGVSVSIKGKNIGTETDFEGKFSLEVSAGDVLQFSYVGKTTLEADVNPGEMNIKMYEDNTNVLDEVTIVGYGRKVEAKSVTYAVKKINAEELGKANTTNVADLLTGKVAGIQVTNSSGSVGSSTRVQLRGINSLKGNTQPLYVIDGVPIDNENFGNASSFGGVDVPTGISDINPDDIESITVLKGPAASALYGVRASNGVIVIKTKVGQRSNYSTNNYVDNRTILNPHKFYGKLSIDDLTFESDYIDAYKDCAVMKNCYQIYLNQREQYWNQPVYFVDIADLFYQKGYTSLAFQILTNLVELDLDNYEILRLFAYKMESLNHNNEAVYAYESVLKLRSEDVQSYRDLALAYQKIGQMEASEKLFKYIVSGDVYKVKERRNFEGVNEIVKRELNFLNAQFPTQKEEEINYKGNSNYISDIRIVIDWNHNDTDIDLHIIEPNKEICYYQNTKTKLGGVITKDMTQGFGPEEYSIEHAKPGTYYVMIKYFGDNYQKIDNPTFMKVTLYTHYGTVKQKEEVKIIRLNQRNDELIVGKVEI
jgi:TonB-dependent SusC/RagA subfamily outer membrane receptor